MSHALSPNEGLSSVEAQTLGRQLSGISGAPGVTHTLSSSTLADGEADENPQDSFHPTTKPHGLGIRCIPPRWEKSSQLLFLSQVNGKTFCFFPLKTIFGLYLELNGKPVQYLIQYTDSIR